MNQRLSDWVSVAEIVRVRMTLFYGDFTTLETADRLRLELMLNTTFRSYEKAYYSERYGILGQAKWQRFV